MRHDRLYDRLKDYRSRTQYFVRVVASQLGGLQCGLFVQLLILHIQVVVVLQLDFGIGLPWEFGSRLGQGGNAEGGGCCP